MDKSEIKKRLKISKVSATRTLRNGKGDISVTLVGEWVCEKNQEPLSVYDTQTAYLFVAQEADIAALRSQRARNIIDEQQFQSSLKTLKFNYAQQIQEIENGKTKNRNP